MFRILVLFVVSLCMAACASTPAKKSPVALQKLTAAGINPETMNRIEAGRVLSYGDIVGLVKTHIPNRIIISYLQSTHAPYRFTDKQLGHLSDVGAGPSLVNYLGKSVGYFEATRRAQTGGKKWAGHPYFNDPGYWGMAPFPYAFPAEWYDPATVGLWF